MDINEQNTPPSAPGGEGQSRPEGKRPHNRGHHRRGRGRPQGDRNAAPDKVTDADKTTGTDKPGTADKPASGEKSEGKKPAGNRPAQNQAQGQKKQGRNRPNDKKPPSERASEEKPSADTAAPNERKSRHSTGRPQRTVRHGSTDTELPNMDNLLIDDSMTAAPSPTASPASEADADEIERILAYDIFATRKEVLPEVLPEGKAVIVGVRFRAGGKTYFFDPRELVCPAGRYAIVETAHGWEFAEICIGNRLTDVSAIVAPLRPVIRLATPEDIRHNEENHQKEQDAFRIGVQKIHEHKLDMKLVEVQYTFDNSKLLFYFTSEKRVDFRELVKDLAGIFHVRIELRQIGIRDEARMIGGLGLCGRPLCCTTFLSDFGQVSMKMAKEQNLSLNSTKISGCCGRLMCCLRYEHEAYVSELKAMPSVGTVVITPDGVGNVTEVFVLKNEVKVNLFGKPDTPPKKFKCDEVEIQLRERRGEAAVAPAVPEEEIDGED